MSTQEYRTSYNYREEYFKQNPGIFGHVWFCSQCLRPLIGKKNVVVDHIRPLNKGGRNHVSNCTACCRECNASKSDIVDKRMYKGYAFKAVESTVSHANKGVGAVASLGVLSIAAIIRALFQGGKGLTKGVAKVSTKRILPLLGGLIGGVLGIATVPIRKGSFASRAMFLLVYILVIVHLLSTKTDLLNAWM